MIFAIIGAFLIGILYAPISCIMMWKKSSYIGDGIVHASMLSGAVSSFFDTSLEVSYLITATLLWMMLFIMKNVNEDNNTQIYFFSNCMTAFAVALSSHRGVINKTLFGDILLISNMDIMITVIMIIITYTFISKYFNAIVLTTISIDIAKIKGIRVKLIDSIYLFIVVNVISLSIKIIGSMLIPAMLIFPAIAARLFSQTPLGMLFVSIGFTSVVILAGFYFGIILDIPISSSIIILALVFYIALYCIQYVKSPYNHLTR